MKTAIYILVIMAFSYATYKMYVAPEQFSKSDYWIALGCIAVATVVTLLAQNKKT